jgi:outer membrane protein assembly factor BamD
MTLLLMIALLAWSEPSIRIAALTVQAQSSPQADDTAEQKATKDMEIGRAYIAHGDDTGAVNRFKLVVTQYPASQYAAEALARLAESFLTLDVPKEARTAVAVLERQFPNDRWTHEAGAALNAFGLAPAEDGTSWISKAFK